MAAEEVEEEEEEEEEAAGSRSPLSSLRARILLGDLETEAGGGPRDVTADWTRRRRRKSRHGSTVFTYL